MVFTAARLLVPRASAGPYRDSEHTAHHALHSSVLPAFFGFCPPQRRQSIGDFIMEKGLCCGVYMAYFVLKALCRPGRPADAYRLIVNDGEHSWLNMVREGAATCFEAWGKDQKANTSLCRPWVGAPIAVPDRVPRMIGAHPPGQVSAR